MQTISFDNGIKEYAINGDENNVIRFNPTDFGLVERIKKAQKKIEELEKHYNKAEKTQENAEKILIDYDRKIRDQINYVFNSDVCTAAFGSTNCMTICAGQPLYQNFLEAVIPILEKDINTESKKAQKRISRYTSQVKDINK